MLNRFLTLASGCCTARLSDKRHREEEASVGREENLTFRRFQQKLVDREVPHASNVTLNREELRDNPVNASEIVFVTNNKR